VPVVAVVGGDGAVLSWRRLGESPYKRTFTSMSVAPRVVS